MQLHELIQQERKKKDLSIYKLAKLTGLTETAISKIEGGRNGRIHSIQAIIKALGINILMDKEGGFTVQ